MDLILHIDRLEFKIDLSIHTFTIEKEKFLVDHEVLVIVNYESISIKQMEDQIHLNVQLLNETFL